MKHKLYASVDEMLSPEVFSELVGSLVTDIHCTPYDWGGASGSQLLLVETNQGQGLCYVLKRISREWDWVMQTTGDVHGREVRLWSRGLMNRLPSEARHVTIACAVDGLGWAILMQDVRDAFCQSQVLSKAHNRAYLDALAAIHATFWEDSSLTDLELGLCTYSDFFALTSPETGYRDLGVPNIIPKALVEDWEFLKTVIDPGLANTIYGLLAELQPIYNALDRYPHTLVHGDYRPQNIALDRQLCQQVVVLDWQWAVTAPPIIDLAWYMSGIGHIKIPFPKDEIIAYYKQALARRLGKHFSEDWWQSQLELCLLIGFLRAGWAFALHLMSAEDEATQAFHQDTLAWWVKRAQAGLKWL